MSGQALDLSQEIVILNENVVLAKQRERQRQRERERERESERERMTSFIAQICSQRSLTRN